MCSFPRNLTNSRLDWWGLTLFLKALNPPVQKENRKNHNEEERAKATNTTTLKQLLHWIAQQTSPNKTMTYLRIPSVLKLSIVLLTFLSCQSMSYLALDMRNSEKCVSAFYPEGTRLDVFYDVLGKFTISAVCVMYIY